MVVEDSMVVGLLCSGDVMSLRECQESREFCGCLGIETKYSVLINAKTVFLKVERQSSEKVTENFVKSRGTTCLNTRMPSGWYLGNPELGNAWFSPEI